MCLIKNISLAAAFLLGSQTAFAANTDADIAQRIAPVGQVHLSQNNAVKVEVKEEQGSRDGVTVYNTTCSACHGVSDDWSARIAQGDALLLEHALQGFNQMPAKGGCASCSDDEIKGAIEYMTSAL